MVNKVLIEIWGYEWNQAEDRSIDQRSSYKDHRRGRRWAGGGAKLYVALLSMRMLPILVTALTWGIRQMWGTR